MDWLVEGSDYVIWRRLAEMSGDRAMAARLDAMHAAKQSGCQTSIRLHGRQTNAPLMLIAEAAVAAQDGQRQIAWREEWVRSLVGLAVESQDETVTEGVVAMLTAMEAVITGLKMARVWPWPAQKKSAEESGDEQAPSTEQLA